MTVTYSLELIRGLGADMHTIADVMDERRAAAQYDADEIGHRVAKALHHFKDNWDDKRELLTNSLRGCGDQAAATADVFESFDEDMAKKVQEILEDKA